VTSIFLEWIKRSLPMGCCKNIASEVSFAALLFFFLFFFFFYLCTTWDCGDLLLMKHSTFCYQAQYTKTPANSASTAAQQTQA
jgi:hypothetical protein